MRLNMMNLPAIVITSPCSSVQSMFLEAGINTRRSFCLPQRRKFSKGTLPPSLLTEKQGAEQPTRNARRSRSVSPPSIRAKKVTSPIVLKRKHLRQVKLPPLPQLFTTKGRKDAASKVPTVALPSSCEEELHGQDYQSPNDPDYMRRASDRWRRRTGAVQLQTPLQLFPQSSCSQHPTFQWPCSPSQQQAFQRRVSPRAIHYPQSPFSSVPTSPILGASPFRRSSKQYSSLNTTPTESAFRMCSRSYSSVGSFSRSRVTLEVSDHVNDHRPSRSPRLGRLLVRAARSVSPSRRHVVGLTRALPERLALDDTVVEQVKKAAHKERLLTNPNGPSLTAPFRRLSARIRKSFRGSKYSSGSNSITNNRKNCSSSTCNSSNNSSNISSSNNNNNNISSSGITSSSSFCNNDNTPMDSLSFTSSTSYQSFLSSSSGYSSDCSSSPSSPAIVPRRLSTPPIPHPATAAVLLAGRRLTFQDIFLDEPQIAEKFAIMFPTEPRPEWHRHLRQVINKAGQKIFKKVEPHETTIPENLRHQLKHIYVY